MPHDGAPVTQLALIPRAASVFSPPTGRRISRPDTDLIPTAICPNEIPKSRAPREPLVRADARLKLLLIKPIYLKTRRVAGTCPTYKDARQKLVVVAALGSARLKYCVLSPAAAVGTAAAGSI